MARSKQIKLLLVEDHKIVRKGLRSLLELEADMKVVGESATGVEAIESAHKLKPDVILLDIALPKLNGLEAARRILQDLPKTKILILTAHADDGYIEEAVNIGVVGYLLKQCSPNILCNSIREVVQGKTCYSPSVAARVESFNGHQTHFNGILGKRTHILSSREREVLQLIAEGNANKQMASELQISIKTIEKHRQNLMNKLDIHDTAGLTRYAIAEGVIECSTQKTTKDE